MSYKQSAVLGLACILTLATGGLAAGSIDPPVGDPIESDWRTIADDELLIIELAGSRRVIIRLAPRYAPDHITNVRALAKAHWWDGTSVYRVQDNWVTQWGDVTDKKALPTTVTARPRAEFDFQLLDPAQRLSRSDAYSKSSGISADGWPIASDGKVSWITHCYGTVGVARGSLPDTGSGSELFVAIGGSARRLDRNYTIVGRVIDGMDYLSALPRSRAEMGIYPSEADRSPILSVRLASDVPKMERPHYQYRTTDNLRFAALIARRENPAPPVISLGGIDVCDVPLASRRVLGETD